MVKGTAMFPATAALAWAVLIYLCIDFGFWNRVIDVLPGEDQIWRAGAEVFLFRVNRQDSSRKLVAEKTSDASGNIRFEDVVDVAKEFPGGKFPPTIVVGDEFFQLIVRAPQRVLSTTSRG